LLVVGKLITLRKTRGHKTDTGEEATEHVFAGGYAILCSQWNSVSGFQSAIRNGIGRSVSRLARDTVVHKANVGVP
jgi:hypothetical protein